MSDSQTPSSSHKLSATKPVRRWLMWLKRCLIAFVVVVAMLVTYMAANLLHMLMDKPDVSVDYLAKINEPILAVPETDWAWPLYREALKKSGYRQSADYEFRLDSDKDDKPLRPGNAEWPLVVAHLDRYADLIHDIREAAKKPALGAPRVLRESPEDQAVLSIEYDKPDGDLSPSVRKLVDGSIIYTRNDRQRLLRRFSLLLATDAIRAFELKDTARAMADIEAQYSFAKQCAAYDDPIGQLLTIGLCSMTSRSINEALFAHARQLSDDQLRQLAALLRQPLPRSNRLEDGDYFQTLDSLQRLYGHSGKVTRDGLCFWVETVGNPPDVVGDMDEKIFRKVGSIFFLPELRHKTATHDEMKSLALKLQKEIKAYGQLPYWEQLRTKSAVELTYARWNSSMPDRSRYWPLLSLWPTTDQTESLFARMFAERQALLVAVVLEQFRRVHETYPKALAALVPDYLAELPVDYSTGLPLLYKLVDGKPLLYGRGLDNDDDGGVRAKSEKANWRRVPEQGDWILFPWSIGG